MKRNTEYRPIRFNYSQRIRSFSRWLVCSIFLATMPELACGDGPDDNQPAKVRLVPPPGLELSPEVRADLLEQAKSLRDLVVATSAKDSAKNEAIVFARAVELAIEFPMLYSDQEIEHARQLLKMGVERARTLSSTSAESVILLSDSRVVADSRLIVGGFTSQIDGSIQPFGLVAPKDFKGSGMTPMRLDVWLHGRDEKTSEVEFLYRRLTQTGEFTPPDTLVLHPYGRYSNAFKFAGEVDVLEAIDHVKKLYAIDEDRIHIRGFSMGGAGCWQFAVHFPGTWCSASPGAGFSETQDFLATFQKEKFEPTWFQKRLLHWYDCPDWSRNLRSLPTIAYSGQLDRQKQAADVMERSLAERNIALQHVIGPNTEHRYHQDSKKIIEDFVSSSNIAGRNRFPAEIDFTTYTLRYSQSAWLHVDGLKEHWSEARIQAQVDSPMSVKFKTDHVTGFTIRLPKNNPLLNHELLQIDIDGQKLQANWIDHIDLQTISLSLRGTNWTIAEIGDPLLSKRPGLQGPIDDAFLSPFLFVPADQNKDDPTGKWLVDEYQHAKREWRRHFRGDVLEKAASVLTDADIDGRNLVLFGTPQTHSLLAKVADRLPIQWTGDEIVVGQNRYSSSDHAICMIYPNPLNPRRYLVINSGFTFREFAYLNNARQIPMLPDWAVIHVGKGANSQLPGQVIAAGFFDESWQLHQVIETGE